jgi:hypothetical protein
VPHVRPETPRHVTHNHDEDCSDDESDEARSAHSDPEKANGTQQQQIDLDPIKMALAVVDATGADSGGDIAAPCTPLEASEAISELKLVD